MGKLSIRAQLTPEHLDLLEAIGFDSDEDLALAGAQGVRREMVKANQVLTIAETVPSLEEVRAWIDALPERVVAADPRPAAESAGPEPTEPDDSAEPTLGRLVGLSEGECHGELLDFEADPRVGELLAAAPIAVPVPNHVLADQGIRPAEIPVAAVLNRADPADVAAAPLGGTRRPVATSPRRRASSSLAVGTPSSGPRLGIDVSKVKHVDEAAADPAPKPVVPVNDRTQLLRTAREETNRGKDPNSRRFVRGVLHDRPWLVRVGCAVALMAQGGVALSIIIAPLLVLIDLRNPGSAAAMIGFLAIPMALPLLGLLYLLVSYRVKCRVCGQRVLVPKQCLKNQKAHRIPVLGHIFALALHTLLFHWFRCTYCGTSVRVKE